MNNIKDFDNFTANPITAFKNAGYYRHRAGWSWNNICEHSAFYCIENGKCTVITEGKQYVCSAGDIIYIKDFENATLSNATESDLSYYFISFFNEHNFNFEINTVTKDTNSLRLFREISEHHRSGAQFSKIKVAELFLRLIHTLCSKKLEKSKDYADSYKLLSVVEYININYYKKITPEYLSALSGYSPAHLRRLFVKNFGVPPMEYILNKKIDMAKEILLDAPEKTMVEIAELVGFCSASYLCKIFKKQTGLSPTEYRRSIGYV